MGHNQQLQGHLIIFLRTFLPRAPLPQPKSNMLSGAHSNIKLSNAPASFEYLPIRVFGQTGGDIKFFCNLRGSVRNFYFVCHTNYFPQANSCCSLILSKDSFFFFLVQGLLQMLHAVQLFVLNYHGT